jgi:hypothetical protein
MHYSENWSEPCGVREKRDDGRTYLVSKPCTLKLVDVRVTVAGLEEFSAARSFYSAG